MHPSLLSVAARDRAGRLYARLWLLAVSTLVAIFACFVLAQPAHAQTPTACSGVPAGGRPQSVDRNANGTIEAGETFNLESCRQITFDIGGTTKTVRVHYTTSNGNASRPAYGGRRGR